MEIHVLIVEDNQDHAETLKHLLAARTEVKYVPESVSSLKDAIARLEKGGIDAVLLDLRLPDAQGIEVIRHVASATKDVGIVVLTGWGSPEDMERPAKEAGADALLIKPPDPVEISKKLQSVVIYRRHTKERHELDTLLSDMGSVIWRLGERLHGSDSDIRKMKGI